MLFAKKIKTTDWIAVFLGNPGSRYDKTRHNAGFMAADETEKKFAIKLNRMKFNSLTAVTIIDGKRVFLMKPQTFMNLSGGAVRQAMKFFRIPLSNVIAISDDVSLSVGKLRVRRRGSAGGHNGLRDIIEKCGGEDFPRIKIGVGAPLHEEYDMADWVLSKLSDKDEKLIVEAAALASGALEMIILEGVDRAMEKYN